ncbi:hypothetical protein GGX14DRAFT_407894 [Mycena pura]|uniref:Uncharacterized protein n=1 Tax=Mycena pura TaxID=153505 RepID=A0AAD6UR89_9AGAR|nr:hypothetical protein GGX14DRAFT_407894 [Mycena pura]
MMREAPTASGWSSVSFDSQTTIALAGYLLCTPSESTRTSIAFPQASGTIGGADRHVVEARGSVPRGIRRQLGSPDKATRGPRPGCAGGETLLGLRVLGIGTGSPYPRGYTGFTRAGTGTGSIGHIRVTRGQSYSFATYPWVNPYPYPRVRVHSHRGYGYRITRQSLEDPQKCTSALREQGCDTCLEEYLEGPEEWEGKSSSCQLEPGQVEISWVSAPGQVPYIMASGPVFIPWEV